MIKPIIVQTFQSGWRLDRVLSISLPCYSRSQIKRWILEKKVMINNQISIFPKTKMLPGERIEVNNLNINNDNNIVVPQNIMLDIIYEDNDILVINKPSNMVVHPGVGNYQNTVLNALLYRYPFIDEISENAGIVQRLDKDTTGLMIIAKTITAYRILCLAFKKREVIKGYEAIVFGRFLYDSGMIDKPIRRHIVHRTCMMVHPIGKSAITYYSVLEQFTMHSRIYISPQTGRTHQIRVHMAHIGHPIVGDQKYGKITHFKAGISNELNIYLRFFNRQALHACTLELFHPITRMKMRWDIPLPQDIINLINMLKK